MLASTVNVDTVEIIVNGQVAETLAGVTAGETKTLTGKLNLPEGGWVNCSIKSSILHKHASFTQRFVEGRSQFL